MQKNCIRCGKSFDCQKEESCWCFKEFKLKQNEIDFEDCICRDCLLLQYSRRLMGV